MTTEGSGDEDLDLQLQPHLSSPAVQDRPAALHDTDVEVTVENSPSRAPHPTSAAHPTWETFDDDDDDDDPNRRATVGGHLKLQPGPPEQNGSDAPPALGPPPPINTIPPPQPSANNGTSPPHQSANGSGGEVRAADVPVTYQRGQETVVMGRDVDYRGGVIRTRHLQDTQLNDTDRPLRPDRIRRLKIMAVVAAILFFPTGLPAVYFSWRIPGLLREGVLKGDIEDALKAARKTRWLLLMSGLLVVLVVAVTLAILERARKGAPGDYNHIAHSSAQG